VQTRDHHRSRPHFFDGPLTAIIDRFATHKVLGLTFAEPVQSDFSAFGEVVEQSSQTVQLKVPRAKVTDACRELLGSWRITDISVQEPPIEEVIRQLFHEEATHGSQASATVPASSSEQM
jgi:ABC-2 type transport system ATP-binding protein